LLDAEIQVALFDNGIPPDLLKDLLARHQTGRTSDQEPQYPRRLGLQFDMQTLPVKVTVAFF
jgi:hypothetical protein